MEEENNIMHDQAMILFERAYRNQMRGQLGDAIELYKRSIATHPTAEAYTFLGWTYSMMDRMDEAIEMCHKAIAIDPDFGNPYNDIGAYLIELGEYEEAAEWLQKATQAQRYQSPQLPHLNLGRIHEANGRFRSALQSYDEALEIDPMFLPGYWAKTALLGKMN